MGVPESSGSDEKGTNSPFKLSAVLRDVTLEVKLCAFRNQALAALLAAAFDDVASSFGGHTGTETVLLFTGTLGGMVSAKAHG